MWGIPKRVQEVWGVRPIPKLPKSTVFIVHGDKWLAAGIVLEAVVIIVFAVMALRIHNTTAPQQPTRTIPISQMEDGDGTVKVWKIQDGKCTLYLTVNASKAAPISSSLTAVGKGCQ
jgi:hypothetical protein